LMSSSTVPLWDTIASCNSCRDERYASSLFKRPSSTSSRLLTEPCCSLTSCTHRNASGKIADSCSNLWASSLKLTCAICRLIFRMRRSYISKTDHTPNALSRQRAFRRSSCAKPFSFEDPLPLLRVAATPVSGPRSSLSIAEDNAEVDQFH
jgi:hypothetical protein